MLLLKFCTYWNGRTSFTLVRFVFILFNSPICNILHQTCQRLRDASFARPIWLRLVQWYSATIQPRPFLPEKPLDLYTDRGLNNIILRWPRVKPRPSLSPPNHLPSTIP